MLATGEKPTTCNDIKISRCSLSPNHNLANSRLPELRRLIENKWQINDLHRLEFKLQLARKKLLAPASWSAGIRLRLRVLMVVRPCDMGIATIAGVTAFGVTPKASALSSLLGCLVVQSLSLF